LSGRDDMLVKVAPLLEMVDDWAGVLMAEIEDKRLTEIGRYECTGRPLGDVSFVERLESVLGRSLRRRKHGPKTKGKENKESYPRNSWAQDTGQLRSCLYHLLRYIAFMAYDIDI
jgi:hypothetical protein